MAKDYESQLEEGRAVGEMVRMEGWQIYAREIRERIKAEYEEIRNFPLDGKGLQDIGAEYIRHREALNAYEQSLAIVDDFLSRKTEAENHFRK